MRTHLLCCPVCNNPPTRRFQGQTRSPEKGMPNPESPDAKRNVTCLKEINNKQ
ncbi:hypothetical protein FKM82_027885 [Ascaphus truei]